MKFHQVEYNEKEYEIVTVALSAEETDWWLVDEWGDLVAAGTYDVGEAETVSDFDWGDVDFPRQYRDKFGFYADLYRDCAYEDSLGL